MNGDSSLMTAEVLEALPGFAELPAAARTELRAALESREYHAREVIMTEGEVGDRVFFLGEGEAEVWIERNGRCVVLALLAGGEMFGELALFDPSGLRSASVTALGPAVCFSISGGAAAWCRGAPSEGGDGA